MQQMKLLPQELVQGMYVAELDRPWTETHFLFQGFKLSNADDIQYIRDTCAYVVIDLEKGEVPRRYRTSAINLTAESRARPSPGPHSISTVSASSRVRLAGKKASGPVATSPLPRRHHDYTDTASVEEEYVLAEEALGAVKSAYNEFLNTMRQSGAADIEGLQSSVSLMESSIVRNPDAMMLLCHLRSRDVYSYHHSFSSSVLAIAFARHLGLNREQIHDLGVGMLLADVGKIHLPQTILDAPRRLCDSELAIVKLHVEHGVKALMSSRAVTPGMTLVVQHHHERYNGSGYPRRLAGDDIPMLGRIAGIVDSYDAMTSDRVYAKGNSCLSAIKELYALRNVEFQAELVEQFIQALGIYPIGTLVELNTGEVAVVIGINRLRRLQPKVMLLLDSAKSSLKDNPIVDLAAQPNDDLEPRSIGQALPPGAFGISPDDYYL